MTGTNNKKAAEDIAVDLLTKLPLYQPITENGIKAYVAMLHSFAGTFDAYCPGCGTNATYRAEVSEDYKKIKTASNTAMALIGGGSMTAPLEEFYEKKEIRKAARCTRDAMHQLICYFTLDGKSLTKVGQVPSLADIATGEARQYKAALGQERLRLLSKGIGLAAHGVGIGSFGYMRRVFESLVEEAHQIAAKDPGWDEAAYRNLRMGERIKALSSHLPEVLVENASLYGVVSLHLHELDEETCLENFPIIKEGIFAIADEKLAQLQREERRRQFGSASQKLVSTVKNSALKEG